MSHQYNRSVTQRRRSLLANLRTHAVGVAADEMLVVGSLPVRHMAAVETFAVQIVPVHRTSRSVQHANLAVLTLSVLHVVPTPSVLHVVPAVLTRTVQQTPRAQHDPVVAMLQVPQVAAHVDHAVHQALLPAGAKN